MHTRTTRFQGFLREDGLWDIEAEMTDVKPFDVGLYREKPLPAGQPVHHLSIRLTVNGEFVVQAVAVAMDAAPFGECQAASAPMQGVVGATLGAGWRQAINSALGGVQGCTHLRELLFNMATVAFQTIPSGKAYLRREARIAEVASDQPPFHVGGCITWDANGPVVAKHYPQFVRWQPVRRVRSNGG